MVHDVLVIGGGPAGAATAADLGKRGRDVVLIEREAFPRFHIGESLIPAVMPLLDGLGAMQSIERAGFVKKYAAEFVTLDGGFCRRYPFRDCLREPLVDYAYEVERDAFDAILLQHARAQGVDVRQPERVLQVETRAEGAVAKVAGAKGTYELRARLVIDATGQSSLVAGHERLRRMDPDLKNFALFAHYEGAQRKLGEEAGDISIVLAEHGWWWVIPLRNNRTSLGYVAPSRSLGDAKPNQDFFDAALARSQYLQRRFDGATRLGRVRGASDYSYRAERLGGDGWLAVGDAAAFLDPVFSTGVFLALKGAERAAEAADRALTRKRIKRSLFRGYEREMQRTLNTYSQFVRGFYRPEFAEILMHPTDNLQLKAAVTSFLAGWLDQEGLSWRGTLFHNIVRANRKYRLSPRFHYRRRAMDKPIVG